MLGMHVTGKTLGVIGMGRIGQAIARRCHAGFGMDVVFHNRSTLPELSVAARQLDSARAVAAAPTFWWSRCRGAETHHLVGQDVFEAMPPHAIFVNIARGDVVDEAR